MQGYANSIDSISGSSYLQERVTEPKHELLVFTKKEILIVLTLLVLVALFSFTIGLKLGKGLSSHSASDGHHAEAEHAPLVEKTEGESHQAKPDAHEEQSHEAAHQPEHKEHKEEQKAATHEPQSSAEPLPHTVDEQVSKSLEGEAKKEGLKLANPVTTTLPSEKKAAHRTVARTGFTLQVGSYRTEAEAKEQVEALRRQNFADAFHFQAQVPGKGTWYRVGVGVFSTRSEAESKGRSLNSQASQMPAFIVQKIE